MLRQESGGRASTYRLRITQPCPILLLLLLLIAQSSVFVWYHTCDEAFFVDRPINEQGIPAFYKPSEHDFCKSFVRHGLFSLLGNGMVPNDGKIENDLFNTAAHTPKDRTTLSASRRASADLKMIKATIAGEPTKATGPEDSPVSRDFMNISASKEEHLEVYGGVPGKNQHTDEAIQPVSMLLLRAVGNSLPPRHSAEQTLRNLDFVLTYEEAFPNLSRHWFLNRLVDPHVEQQVVQRLQQANESYTIIPFDLKSYDSHVYRFDLLDFPDQIHSTYSYNTYTGFFLGLNAEDRIMRDKLVYTANVNGVRNEMLNYGRHLSSAEYILPFDGNCFLARNAWEAMQRDIQHNPAAKYFAVPMDRLVEENAALLSGSYKPNPVEEPQIIFHRTSIANFNPNLPYGRRNKVDLLRRLGIKGIWENNEGNKWDVILEATNPVAEIEANVIEMTGTAGWISRLYSGNKNAELTDAGASTTRVRMRRTAISTLLDRLDLRAAVTLYNFTSNTMLFYDEQQLYQSHLLWKNGQLQNPMINSLMEKAAQSLNEGPWSVVDKRSFGCGPSLSCRDYYNPWPYMWPQRNESGSIDWTREFVMNNGEILPGSVLYTEGSEHFDYTRLESMQRNTTVLALAYAISANQSYAEKAAANLRVWFLEPGTRMNPNLSYTQVAWVGNPPQWRRKAFGTIEMSGVYFFLDAVRIVEGSGALSILEIHNLRRWFREYLHWLYMSNGRKEASEFDPNGGIPEVFAPNHIGLNFDIQLASVAAYCGNLSLAVRTIHRAVSRLDAHVNSTGAMPKEQRVGSCEHFTALALNGWSVAARVASSIGIDYWRRFRVANRNISKLCLAMEYGNPLLDNRETCAGDGAPIDPSRWWPLFFEAKSRCPHLETRYLVQNERDPPERSDFPSHHNLISGSNMPYSGVAPFWNLNLPP
jgi:hypothetical protein